MKLYWRIKKNGKWTWKSAGKILEMYTDEHDTCIILENLEDEE